MNDIVDPATRSRMMAAVRQKDTKPEVRLRRLLHRRGLRYSLHRRDLPGRPDIVLSRHRSVVFVHGCFWHRHPGCRRATTPKTNREFWETKFAENVTRDARAVTALEMEGWRVFTVWECGVTSDAEGVAERLGRAIEFGRHSPRVLPEEPPYPASL